MAEDRGQGAVHVVVRGALGGQAGAVAVGVVEVLRDRQQVRVVPDLLAGAGAALRRDAGPQLGRVAGPARAQLQADERGERVLRRATGGPTTAHHLPQRSRVGQVRAGGRSRDLVDPALDEGQRRLEAQQCGVLLRCRVEREHSLGEGVAQGLRVRRVDRPDGLLERGHVDGDASRVGLHGPEEVRAQPRDVREQAGVRGLAQREEEPDLVDGHVEALGEVGDVAGDERGAAALEEGQADVGRAEDLACERPGGLADLHAEHRTAELAHHLAADVGALRVERVDGVGRLRPQGCDQRVRDGGGDGLGERAPARHRVLDPVGAAPRADRAAGRRQVRGGVEPGLGGGERGAHLAHILLADRRVALRDGDLAGQVVRELPVHGVVAGRVQYALDLTEDLAERLGVVGDTGRRGERLEVEGLAVRPDEADGAQVREGATLGEVLEHGVGVGAEHRAQEGVPRAFAAGTLVRFRRAHPCAPEAGGTPP